MKFLEYFYDQLEKTVKPTKALYYKPTQLIFLLVLKDYLEEKISVNYFTSAATQLYYQLNNPSDFSSNSTAQELGSALEDASEIEYYQKNANKNESTKKMYAAMIKNLKEYFDKYKHLLEK